MIQCHQTGQRSKRMVEDEVSTVEQRAWLFVMFFLNLKNSDFTPKILKADSWDLISIFQLPDCLIYIVGFLTSDITQPEIATEDNQTTLKFAQYIAIICLVHNYELYSLIYYFAWWKQYKGYHSTHVMPIIEVSNLPFISEISFT